MININLIAERRARKQRESNILRMSSIGVLLVIFAMVTLNLAWSIMRTNAANDLAKREKEVRAERVKLEAFRLVKAEVAEKDDLKHLLDQVRVSEGAWMIILADISRVIPHDVTLMRIDTSRSRERVLVNMDGTVKDLRTLAAFKEAIPQRADWAQTPQLGRVTLQRDNETGEQRMQFKVSVPVLGLYGGEL